MSEWQDLDSLYDEPEKVKPHYGEREREPEYKAETPGSTDEWLELDDSLYASPEPEKEPMGTFEGAAQALRGGVKQVKESIDYGAAMTAQDYEGAAETISEMEEYREAHPARPEAEELMTAYQEGGSIIGGVKGVLGEMAKDIEESNSAWEAAKETGKNVRAMGEGILKQTPNMVPPMTGLLAGGAAGSAVLPGVGTALGAWGGASAGNTLVEGQFIAIEALHKAGIDLRDEVAVASFLEENAGELFQQAATKGATIGAVDVVTMGLMSKMLTAPAKAATQRTLLDMGVDVTNREAVKKAVNSNGFAERVFADATYQASKQGITNMARNITAFGMEPTGEFLGEYLGQGLATGDWDEKEAFLEAMSSLGQSGFTFLGQKGYQTVTRPKEYDPVDQIVDALIDPNRAPEERQNAANEIYTRLNDESPVLGQAWARFAQDAIDNGSVIDYEKFSEAFNSGQLEGESLGPIQRAAERTPEKDRKQVQQIVAPVEDEEQAQREAAAETTEEKPAVTGEQAEVKKFEKESEAYRKEANTKEGQKKKEEAQKKAKRQQELKRGRETLGKKIEEEETTLPPKIQEEIDEDKKVDERAGERKDEPVGGRVAEKGSMVAGERYEGSPSEAKIEADNYKRPKKNVHGMTLSFENPKGSVRSGTDQDGRAWKIRMKNDYGRILGTKGMDKEHIDFFAADNYDGKGDTVYIVDQHNKDGSFDEHKVVFGAKNEMDALKIYNANYEAGWTGGKAVTRMGMDAFKVWSTSNAPQNGPAARTRNIQQRKDTKYSTKPEIEGEGGAVDIATIKKEFKGSKVVDHGKGDGGNIYEITTPSGMTLFVHSGLNEIKITDTKKADRDWEGVNPQQAYEDDLAAGTFQMAGRNGLIRLISDAEERSTLRHETYHAVERMALTQREINILARKFGKEEGRAVAYQKWRNNRVTDTRTDKFFQKIFDFALRLMHSFMPTAASTFREIESGRPLRRAQKRKAEGGGVRYERKKKTGPVKVPKVKLPKDRTSLRSAAKNIPFITEPVTLRKEPDPTLELQVGISGVPATRQDQISRLEKIAKKHPNPLKSRLAWRKFIADVTGSTGTSIIEPTRAIGWVKDHNKLKTYLKQMTKGQRKSSRDGMRLERQIGQKIKNGELTVDDFTMILTWVGLSRMLTAAIHEAGFLRAMNNDILEFARKVGKGEWTEADTEAGLAWVEKHFPKGGGMPSGAKSNLNATFRTTFPALSSAVSSDGKQLLHKIYSMFQEGKTAAEIRREFMFHAGDSGIQAKIFSFAMLWESVVVIDRWQVRNFWADNKALEDAGEVTVTTVNDKTGKKTTTTQPVIDAAYDKIPMGHKKENGADAVGGMVKYLDGPQGIAIYEGIERGLAEASAAVYGKPDVARLHWESWLIVNDQEVGHASLKAIRDRDLEGKGVKEGRKIITENDIFAIEEGQEIYYIQDEQGTYTRLTKDEYLKIQGNKKETVRGRRGKAAARNAAERESRAVADGTRPDDAARERRAYQRKDAILGVRRELRALFERSRGKDQERLPQPYRRGTDKYARRDVGGQKLSTNLLTPVKGIEKVFALGGISHPKLHQLNTSDKKFRAESALAFQNAITSAKANNDYGAAVYVYSQKEYEEMQLFLTEDGMAGFALKGTDMVSLFSNKKGDHSAVTNALLLQGIAEGGRKCDCFDTALPYMYGDLGMRVASREPWDERWKPEGWSKQKFAAFNNGEPDVLYMVYDPNYFDQYQPGDGRYLKDSVAAQNRWVEKLNKMIESGEQPMYSRLKADPGPIWNSPTVNAIRNLKMEKGTGQQFWNMIRKAPGVKAEELEWMGLEEWLTAQKKITNVQVLQFALANGVQVEEVERSGESPVDALNEVLHPMGWEATMEHDEAYFIDPEGLELPFDELPREIQDRIAGAGIPEDGGNAKFSSYTLPGGKNYKELLLTLPTDSGNTIKDVTGHNVLDAMDQVDDGVYRTSHWDEPNVLAHVRFNERLDADGNRVLFIEEVQSDWHQEGRREGYKEEPLKPVSAEKVAEKDRMLGEAPEGKSEWEVFLDSGDSVLIHAASEGEAMRGAIAEIRDNLPGERHSKGVPDAPFKKSWPLLSMKRMIRYAAENGFDKIAWTTGEQQADRYDLSKQVDAIYYFPIDNGKYDVTVVDHQENSILSDHLNLEEIEKTLGKEIAEKIKDSKGSDDSGVKRLSGIDLKVGGEGMRAFYDKMLPSAVSKFIKKYGAKVEAVSVKTNSEETSGYALAKHLGNKPTTHTDQLSFPLTDKMRESAIEQGMPMFSRKVVGLETSPIDESPTLQMLREKVNERMKVRPPVKTVLPPDQGKQILSTLVTPKGNISAAKVASKLQGYEKVVAKMRDDKLDIEAKIDALTEFITKKVPKDVKAHNHVHKAYARVVKGKTEEARLKDLARTIDRIDQLNDQYLRRESLKAIKAYMKKQRPKLKGAVSRQPKGWDLYQEWLEIRDVMAMPEEEVAKELEALEDMLDKGQLYTEEEQDRIDVLIDRKRKGEANEGDLMELRKLLANGSEAKLRRLHSYATLKGRSGLEVYDAFQKLQAELETLKLGWIDQMEQARAKLVERREKAISDITGGKDLMTPNQENKLKAEEQRLGKRIINQIRGYDDKHQSWEWMLDKLSRFSDAGILSSNLVKDFGRLVSRATLAEQVGLTDRFTEIQQKMAEIWGVDPNKPRLLNKARQADALIEEAPVNRYDEEGKLIEKLAMSKNQAYKRWMEWQDLSLRDNLRKQGYTEKTIDEIWTWLTPELKAWAQWQLKEFYQDYHEGSASVFRQLFYTELAKTDNYSPIRREYDRGKEDNNLLKTNTPWSSVLNSATKQRIKNNRGIMLQDGDEVLARHITEMEHFKAWGIPMRELRTVLGGERVRKAIRQYHGSTALQVVNNFMDDFARGKVDQKFQSEWVSFFRRNFTTGAVGANPVVFVKQLTSIPAFAMDMPVKDWLGGLARMNTPGKARRAYRILKSSKLIQERYKVGFERDMIAAVMGGGTRSTTGTRNLADRMMILTKKGDWLAIFYGGWPVYEYHHKQAIKAGSTEAEASAIAMEAFEEAVTRTQQAGQLKDQNQYQRGSAFHQLFTMFYTAPSAYYRSWAGGVRGLQGMSAKEWSKLLTGRGDKKRYAAAKRVFFGQVVLPAMFMLASNGGEWDKDDMLKAVLLGPLSGLFLIRDFGIGLYNLTTGQNNYQDPGLPPVFSTVGEAGTAIRKGYKRSLDFTQQDLGEWMTDPDTWEFIQSALTAGGNVSGIPLGPMTRTAEGVYGTATGKTVAPKRRWIGFSEKKLDQTKRDYDKVARKMRLGGKGTKGHDAWKSYDKHVRTLNKIIRNDPGRSRQDNLDLMKRRADIMDRFLNLYNEL